MRLNVILRGFLTATLLCGLTAAGSAREEKVHDLGGETGKFKTLLTAIHAAGLFEPLGEMQPVTIFAPTEEAFAKLPEGTIEALLADKPKLRSILKYHVVAGRLPASKVIDSERLETVLGQTLAVSAKDGVTVGGAKVLETDLACDVGIVHAIDRVLLPQKDIVDVAKGAGSFETLLTAVAAAELMDTLRGKGPFTVFAPTDEAFAKVPADLLKSLLADKAKLTEVLTFHVVSGSVPAAKVVKSKTLTSVEGSPLRISVEKGSESGETTVMVGGAKVLKTDIEAANGTIHVIDTVLLPPKFAAK